MKLSVPTVTSKKLMKKTIPTNTDGSVAKLDCSRLLTFTYESSNLSGPTKERKKP